MIRILLIALAISVAAAGFLFWQNGKLHEDVATAQANTQIAKDALTTQLKANQELRELIAEQNGKIHEKDIRITEARKSLDRTIERFNNARKNADAAALAEPERVGAISTYIARRGMRSFCRASGGSADECRIQPVSPAKARSGASGEPGDKGSNP